MYIGDFYFIFRKVKVINNMLSISKDEVLSFEGVFHTLKQWQKFGIKMFLGLPKNRIRLFFFKIKA